MSSLETLTTEFLSFHLHLRLYHWTTTSYARHKASCELIDFMNDKIDTFVETLSGLLDTRLVFAQGLNTTITVLDDQAIIQKMHYFKSLLDVTFTNLIPITQTNMGLYTLRDEIKNQVDKTLYLFSFS
uniref:Uncharacterized protein n=1 Tax=viral metagenome TaxID=1070528 RepID=A0A6C0CSS1_9ZZZZ